jgi:rRNA processing protein Gar1
LRSLGNISFFTNGGQLLIRSKAIPRIYSNISTNDGKAVGKVADIIGPVMNPHIVVRPTPEISQNHALVKGRELFEQQASVKRKGDKRWKKRR